MKEVSGQGVRDLSAAQLGELARLLRERKGAAGATRIPRSTLPPARFRLTSAQERLWFLAQLEPQSPAYHVAVAIDLEGELLPALLRAALQEVVERHRPLTASFRVIDGEPWCCLNPGWQPAWPVVDLGALEQREAESVGQGLARAWSRFPFALDQGNLLRVLLVRLSVQSHQLCLVCHHIVVDGWSCNVLARELSTAYAARLAGVVANLPPLPLDYADYAAWQHGRQQSGELARLLAQAVESYGGAAHLELAGPSEPSRLGVEGGARQEIRLSAEIWHGVQQLAATTRSTTFSILLASLAAFLSRASGELDVVIGSPFANRSRLELDGLIGLFVNSGLLRLRLRPSDSFTSVCEQAIAAIGLAQRFQEVPFEHLVEALEPKRDLGRNPLFQVMLAVEPALDRLRLPGLDLELSDIETGSAKLDLLFAIKTRQDGIEGYLEHRLDRFDPATAERILRQWERLLAAGLENPSRPWAELALLSPAEVAELTQLGAGPRSRTASKAVLHGVALESCARVPDRCALIVRDEHWSHAGLETASADLAERLRALGLGPETRVGVCLERSADLVVALLAVLRAGGAYVPLDPAYPVERLAWMIDDSRARWVLTRTDLAASLPSCAAELLDLDTLRRSGDSELQLSGPPGAGSVEPENLAYVIYTSGSTGRPKGVAIDHRSAVSLLDWALEAYSPAELTGVLATTSVCFDLSIFELFVPLAAGGTILLAENALDVARLPTAGVARLINSVPSAVQELLAQGGLPPSVRTVNLAGEALPGRLVDDLRAAGVEAVWNLYGPSEDTTYSTGCRVPAGQAVPSIGRALPATELFVVGPGLTLLPRGAPGELLIASSSLARGYLGKPALTAERFLPNPFSGSGGRVYRTGDRVRWRPDGELSFLGRFDHQVKIRGFRIELGEIEGALGSHPALEAGVVAVSEAPTGPVLVAYLEAKGEPPSPEALRDFLAASLPTSFLPQRFVFLHTLPRTPNGKVDRRALPQVQWDGSEDDEASVPEGPRECLLAEVWSEVLSLASVGRRHSFFSLGGHSLLAARLVERLARRGWELPVRAVFEAPTLAAQAARLRPSGATSSDPARADRTAPQALSFAQERLWFLHQLDPLDPAYHMPLTLRPRGPVPSARLWAGLEEVVRRHEVLRTCYPVREGVPRQEILETVRLPRRVVDLSVLECGHGEGVLARLSVSWARLPFDLSAGPVLRAVSWRLDGGLSALTVVLHHVAGDGESLRQLVRELLTVAAEGPAALRPASWHYADFAAHQRALSQGENHAADLEAWREALAGALEPLELPADRPRGRHVATSGRELETRLSGEVWGRLRALALARSGTPFTVLLACFGVLLFRLTQRSSLIVGTPVSQRDLPEWRDVLGCFLNLLPVPLRLERRFELGELLADVGGRVRQALARQQVPFEQIVDALGLPRQIETDPLFQVLFVYQGEALPVLRCGETVVEVEDVAAGGSRLDLTVAAFETAGGGLGLRWEFRSDLFEASTVERWARAFGVLAQGAGIDPAQTVGRLAWLSREERDQEVHGWNPVQALADPATGATVPELVRRQAARTPEAIALDLEDEQLSYQELLRRVDRAAAELRSIGLSPEARVGIHLERSIELVIATLAVMDASAAYVPLEPSLPAERLAFVCRDAGLSAIIGRVGAPAALLDAAGSATWILTHDWASGSTSPAASLGPEPRRPTAEQLAYVLYTSGSTGQPKGVGNTHAGIVHRLRWVDELRPLTPEDRLLHKTPFGFDVSIGELFWPLSTGARLVVARPGGHEDPGYLARALVEQAISIVHFVPSMLQVFLDVQEDLELPALRRVLASGEALRPDLVKRFERRFEVELLNLYGPTEAAIEVSWAAYQRDRAWTAVTIGRPAPGTTLRIVDADLEPVLLGVPGELLIGGVQLARGYWNRQALTAERFVPDPFAATEGARVYRTGDRVRRLPSGEIDFLGRLDHQVKLRGLRIELPEIESALGELPGIVQAVVVARESKVGGYLVAYLAGAPETLPSQETVLQALRAKLPAYMVPSLFVRLDALPLTPSGKVDRRALPPPTPPEGADPSEPPQGALELEVAAAMAEVLGAAGLGRRESFFERGGHSLLAVQLLARLRRAVGVELPVRTLFEAPTVAELAERVALALQVEGPATSIPSLGLEEGPATRAQERLWFLETTRGAAGAYHVSFAVRLTGRLVPEALAAAWQDELRRQPSLRTVFALESGRLVQRVLPRAEGRLAVLDLSALEASDSEARSIRALERVAAFAQVPFDLGKGPLARAALFCVEPEVHVLAVALHHAIADGWSIDVLVRDWAELYSSRLEARPARLPTLPLHVTDVGAWERRRDAAELAREVSYWRERLAGAPPSLALPTDRPRRPGHSHRGSRLAVRLASPQVRQVVDLARRMGATPFMVLLSAWAELLGRWGGQREVVVGAPVSGRFATELEPLVGCFLNTLALRLGLGRSATFEESVEVTREAVLGGLAHQRLAFEEVLREVRRGDDRQGASLFETFVNFLGFPFEGLKLPDLELEPLWLDDPPAKVDFTLYVRPLAGEYQLELVYDAELFSRSTAEALLEQYQQLLGAALEQPRQPLDRLSLALVRATPKLGRRPGEGGAHLAFFAQAAREPSRVAFRCGPESFSYGELAQRALALAAQLRSAGLGRERVVAVWTGRTVELAVAVLGILGAGAAFVVLDPSLPAERLCRCLEQAGPAAWVAAESLDVPEEVRESLRRLGAVVASLAAAPASATSRAPLGDLPIRAEGNDLAYLAFTSGSTGVPKVVAGEHAPLEHFLAWYGENGNLSPTDRVSMLSGLGHDPLLRDLLVPLSLGGTVVAPLERGPEAGAELGPWLARERITVVHWTPSLSRVARGTLPDLRLAVFGGEAVLPGDVERLAAQAPGARLLSFYGATETPQAMAWQELGPGTAGQLRVPLGQGIEGVAVEVWSALGVAAGVRELGEVVITTPYLARGYWRNPRATAERFVPAGIGSGLRAYRTGDLGRYDHQGRVEAWGRADRQLKVRGYRVEPLEIESALERHPEVATAAVVGAPQAAGGLSLAAYVVPWPPARPSASELRAFLATLLPSYCLPSSWTLLEALPRTANGKLDVSRLPPPATSSVVGPASVTEPRLGVRARLEARVAEVWCRLLGTSEVGRERNFFDAGGHSLLLMQLQAELRQAGLGDLSLVDLFGAPTVAAQAELLAERSGIAPAAQPEASPRRSGAAGTGSGRIAVVGLAGRFPGAADVEAFWSNLVAGRESISFFSAEELAGAEDPEVLADPAYVRAKGVLDRAEWFDAEHFGYSAREAELLDPQQRALLEVAWQALEDAGHAPDRFGGRIGVFAGSSLNTYLLALADQPDRLRELGGYAALLAGDKDHLATRISYRLGLTGPSLTVQTTCSTSLVAIHTACRSLLDGECDMALAGGVSITFPTRIGYRYEEGGIGSPDGHCRPFDARARGTVGGNGAGLVVLRRLEDALADGDAIRAVVLGSAINNDGLRKVGYTAPSLEGQVEVLRAAHERAGIEPADVQFIETHGTGTELGDPIELTALDRALGDTGEPCALGAVKANIGHLSAAAGVAGFLKTVLALERELLPPSAHVEEPIASFPWERSRLRLHKEPVSWSRSERPRVAGVSSFGFGGTNAHLVLTEAPPRKPAESADGPHLLMLSARTEDALAAARGLLADHLERHPELGLPEVAHTLFDGRMRFAHRTCWVSSDSTQAVAALRSKALGAGSHRRARELGPSVVFAFPGQGAQRVGVAGPLYRSERVFRGAVDHCLDLLESSHRRELRELLLDAATCSEAAERLRATALAQPALFILEHALAQLWQSWGVRPRAVVGHSVGEYAAAVVAGVLDVADALSLVVARGRLMEACPRGAMLGVGLGESAIRPYLTGDLELAAVNGPGWVVVGGPEGEVEALGEVLRGLGLEPQRLMTSHAFHTRAMEAVLPAFERELAGVRLRPATVPMVSSLTGGWLEPDEASDSARWVMQIRRPVRFGAALSTVFGGQETESGRDARLPVLLEVGPGAALTALARHHGDLPGDLLSLASVRGKDPRGEMLAAAGELWCAGHELDPAVVLGDGRPQRVALPGYPFERKRYSVHPELPTTSSDTPRFGKARYGLPDSARDSSPLHVPVWRPGPLAASILPPGPVLVCGGANQLATALRERLDPGVRMVEVVDGAAFRQLGPERFALRFGSEEDAALLRSELGCAPRQILWLALTGPEPEELAGLSTAVGEVLRVARACSAWSAGEKLAAVALLAVTQGSQGVGAERPTAPLGALAAGLSRVLPLESPSLVARWVDLDPAASVEQAAAALASELAEPPRERLALPIAWRGGRRWQLGFEPFALPPRSGVASGAYLVTGGFTGVGLELARALGSVAPVRLGLLARTPLPPRETWPGLLEGEGESALQARVRAVLELEAAGAEVLPLVADVGDAEALNGAIAALEARFGELRGVVHAAGLAGGGLFYRRTAEEAAAVLAPKVLGARNLLRALAGRRLDFCVLCSSRQALLARPGQFDYCAANAYLDALAQQTSCPEQPVVAVGWQGWQGLGMAAAVVDDSSGGSSAEEGRDLFLRLLGSAWPYVLVSSEPISELLARYEAIRELPTASSRSGLHARPELAVPYREPATALERQLAILWCEVLGVASVGCDDSFFELGGDSVLGLQIAARARRAGLFLSPRLLFEYPTVALLAGALASTSGPVESVAEGAPPAAAADASLEALLDRTELSLEEYDEILGSLDLSQEPV